ncbi:SGNH/GDSL hydrolase family protein [Paractinoplanes brasiliensis]|uniref:Lysophospholipase L1-like esterase n=1 Tax=Paractinoplanes brasiliensis TaxID=52695 RepID=A0A4R6JRE7_9ACTN|nr:SGNH/GDSL hydrolase family protein [Actinoplanes brasiliensis]TDO37486.1 lysophospholipase L1-like esterase [Actinoplanes brasiliensis]GID29194.1 hypothetical protein Abr02nite_41770 [Actinoplanes brasiliensis]
MRTAARLGGLSLATAFVAATLSGPCAAAAEPESTGVAAAVPVAASSVAVAAAEPAYGPLKVMPLGDSITYGSGSADSRVGNRTGAPTASGYRVELGDRLRAAGLDVDFVGSQRAGPPGADTEHEGHSGWRIDQIAANVDGWLAGYEPDAVLLHLGTNDMAQNMGVRASADRLSALIDQIRAARPDAGIFVQRLVQGHIEPYRSRIAAFNSRIPGIVAGKDAKVHLVDQSAIGGLSIFDNLHPNDHGYAKMAYNLYRAMAAVYLGDSEPAGANPYAVTTATLCFQINSYATGKRTWHARCSPWTRRGGQWQRPGTTTETALTLVPTRHATRKVTVPTKVRVEGRYVTRTVNGKKKRVWVKPHHETRPVARTVKVLVPAHYETRTRTVSTWLTDDPYLTHALAVR